MSRPFGGLDALYTSILQLNPVPEGTVLWLKAQQLLRNITENKASAWTVNRLFESSAGQAQMFLGVPSLVYMHHEGYIDSPRDSCFYAGQSMGSTFVVPDVGWNATYAFYHKSFLDYLEDRSRCGAAFPGIGDGEVVQWIWGRLGQTLKCEYATFLAFAFLLTRSEHMQAAGLKSPSRTTYYRSSNCASLMLSSRLGALQGDG
jgi:hypothetical protein